MGMLAVIRRDGLEQFSFDGIDILAGGKAGAVAEAKDVGVDGDGRFSEHDIEDDVGRLAADAGQGFEGSAVMRHFAAVFFQQLASSGEDVFCLGFVEPDGLDVIRQLFFTEGGDLLGCRRIAEECAGGEVDALVSGLCRENHRDQ